MSRCLATRISAAATSRTCETLPAWPSTSPELMVCTESTTSRSGWTWSMCPRTVARSVSAARNSLGRIAPIRSARSRTWEADSSPVTYRTVRPEAAVWPATSSSRVDLPTPGSPATRTTAPGTSPPPRTRSSSSTRVGTARAVSTSTWSIGRAGVVTAAARVVRTVGAPTSSTLPHAWHSPQRPTHLPVTQPHSTHRYPGRVGRAGRAALPLTWWTSRCRP